MPSYSGKVKKYLHYRNCHLIVYCYLMDQATYDISKSKISLSDGTIRTLNNSIFVSIQFLGGDKSKEMLIEIRTSGRGVIEMQNSLSAVDYSRLETYNAEANRELALVAVTSYVLNVLSVLSRDGRAALLERLSEYRDKGVAGAAEASDLTVHTGGVKAPMIRNNSSLSLSLIHGHLDFENFRAFFGLGRPNKDHHGSYSTLGLVELVFSTYYPENLRDDTFAMLFNSISRTGVSKSGKLTKRLELEVCSEVLDQYRMLRENIIS